MRPLIGITVNSINQERHHTIHTDYVQFVRRAGGLPAAIFPCENCLDISERFDGIILSGGGDLHPFFYGGSMHEEIAGVDEARDLFELDLARLCFEKKIPLLAICRGMQVANVALGGTLHEHIPDVLGNTVAHKIPGEVSPHLVKISKDCMLYNIIAQDDVTIASWHHQGIKDPAPVFRVTALSSDGLIEACEIPGQFYVCVQWHPEKNPSMPELFSALVWYARENQF